jgi:poly-gamma-glutamate capsule biosynthesis protein CapA/YwtB (metallophosphatase superfamily)
VSVMRRLRPACGAGAVVVVVLLLAGCPVASPERSAPLVATASPTPESAASPAPTEEARASPTSEATPTPTPTATPAEAVELPLAVVTGFTSPRRDIVIAELEQLLDAGQLAYPCGVELTAFPAPSYGCTPAEEIVQRVVAARDTLALLPPGLIEPKVKALSVAGADLFGSAAARQLQYPVVGVGEGLPPEWTAYNPAEIRTVMSVGESCPDRGVAHQAITLGQGWEWVFGGGTAAYTAVYPNPAPPGAVGSGFNIVEAVTTGNEGAVWRLIGSADLTVEDFECPVVNDWTVNEGVVFSIDPRVVGHMAAGGTDVVTLAANHTTDWGLPGLLETVDHFAANGIRTTGAGATLSEALEPAVVEVSGLTFGVVGWNIVPGAVAATESSPGVAWTTEENVRESVRRAREQADVVICMPQWGYPEYRAGMTDEERAWQVIFFEAGCDHLLGHGTHWAGQLDFERGPEGDVRLTVLSHGNFLFGQNWSQETQEGMLVEVAFRGTQLAQVRLHPYIMLLQAQAALTDPATDGSYLLQRVFAASELDY